ncbi:unnamed protein product [Macrosiphum euphorbiae]|uniref:Uncharacterized protein n=1 Tax=Macrosiphum euphorbiae TaxID=13131 RepID=A0AAV0VKE1_9HEMI|nr:unnamed protein product [Macrosiphum euphorbiae]
MHHRQQRNLQPTPKQPLYKEKMPSRTTTCLYSTSRNHPTHVANIRPSLLTTKDCSIFSCHEHKQDKLRRNKNPEPCDQPNWDFIELQRYHPSGHLRHSLTH